MEQGINEQDETFIRAEVLTHLPKKKKSRDLEQKLFRDLELFGMGNLFLGIFFSSGYFQQ